MYKNVYLIIFKKLKKINYSFESSNHKQNEHTQALLEIPHSIKGKLLLLYQEAT